MDAEREKVIAQAVDAYLLMERKARAWDELQKVYVNTPAVTLDEAFKRVHSALARSSS